MYVQINEWMDGWFIVWMMDRQVAGQVDRCMGGWADGWMDSWLTDHLDRRMDKLLQPSRLGGRGRSPGSSTPQAQPCPPWPPRPSRDLCWGHPEEEEAAGGGSSAGPAPQQGILEVVGRPGRGNSGKRKHFFFWKGITAALFHPGEEVMAGLSAHAAAKPSEPANWVWNGSRWAPTSTGLHRISKT